jgi:F0F1-type ATP synthase assembly protein I
VLSRSRGRTSTWAGSEQGWAAACTLVAGILVWGGIGALLDRVFGTWPVLFAIGAFVGNFAAIYLIYVRFYPGEKTRAT